MEGRVGMTSYEYVRQFHAFPTTESSLSYSVPHSSSKDGDVPGASLPSCGPSLWDGNMLTGKLWRPVQFETQHVPGSRC